MTEAEWVTSGEPGDMVEFVRDERDASERQIRLWACACCRRLWHLIPYEHDRISVEVAERFADGLASEEERAAAENPTGGDYEYTGREPPEVAGWHFAATAASTACDLRLSKDPGGFVYYSTSSLGCVAARKNTELQETSFEDGYREKLEEFMEAVEAVEKIEQARIARDIFGNPFRAVSFDAEWRTATVIRLAQHIYETRDFDTMPILADALQDAGCNNADILSHCRDAGQVHVRGCWVLDGVLGKS